MKRILVTGLGGFIGRRVAPFLLERAFEVHGIGRSARPAALDERVAWSALDVLDHRATAELVQRLAPSHCLHLAWYTEHGKYWRSAQNFTWLQASLNLLSAFVEAGGRRFVGAGTCAEYDWSAGVLSETLTPRTPATPFGRCRNALFEAAMAYAEMTGISVAWGRVFFPYGFGESEARLVPHVITSLLAGRPAKTSSGEQLRDFIFVDDVAAGFAALLDSDVRGGVNLASGQAVAVSTVVQTIARLMGHPELVELGAIPPRPGDPPLLVADVRRLHEEVGYRPRWDLEAGLAATIRSYRR